jgi:SnoaL-like domain
MTELATTERAPSAAAAAWVEAFAEGWRAPRDADSFVDHFLPWLAPEIRLVQPQMPVLVGHEAFRRGFARPLFDLIPDLHGEVVDWAAHGDRVYIELVLRGTVGGPGGRPVTLHTVDRVSLGADGRATERVAHMDPSPLAAAVATAPRAWPAFVRAQLRMLLNRRRLR